MTETTIRYQRPEYYVNDGGWEQVSETPHFTVIRNSIMHIKDTRTGETYYTTKDLIDAGVLETDLVDLYDSFEFKQQPWFEVMPKNQNYQYDSDAFNSLNDAEIEAEKAEMELAKETFKDLDHELIFVSKEDVEQLAGVLDYAIRMSSIAKQHTVFLKKVYNQLKPKG